MERIDEILSQLNSEQIKPVLDTEGAVLVIAGAGSGKTRVLTSRIAYLLMQKNVRPENIMAITFTNKAAGEMKERLEKIANISGMWVSTIHSMCVKILRNDIDKIGFDRNFTIYDETDKDKVLKRVFEELGLEADKFLKTVKSHISIAKNECMYPEEYKEKNSDVRFIDEICSVYKAYDDKLAKSNSLDFDDLLFKTYELFYNHPEVADYYSNKFQYIHVDEFQDTNKVQFAIIQRLSIKHGNIFVVGDDDQSIYGWRGAVIDNILNFDDIYRGAKIYKLERNYRSTKKILDLANCIIKNNTGRRPKSLWTENEDGARVETSSFDDEIYEARHVSSQISALMSRHGYKYSDFAIFMRVNALSRAIEQELARSGIPYRVYGGFRFFERKEIKDVLSYLKVVNNNFDDESFLRAVSTPRRGIGDKTLSELREYCASNFISLYEGLTRLDQTTISGAAKTRLFNFKLLLDSIGVYAKDNSVSKTIQFVLDSTSFLDQFSERNEENTSRLMNIDELKNSAEMFEKDNPYMTLSDYLNLITLSSDTDDMGDEDVVTIATIHSVKGLEFKCVFIVGADEKILPLDRSISDEDELEEERRLMYVAITRAMERLYILRANSRYLYGRREYMTMSRFLSEGASVLGIATARPKLGFSPRTSLYGSDERVYDDNKGSGYSSAYAKTMLNANKPQAKVVNTSAYKSGMRVKHAKFGEGIIITVKGTSDNLIVDVAFKGVGIKSLSVKYAPMEIL